MKTHYRHCRNDYKVVSEIRSDCINKSFLKRNKYVFMYLLTVANMSQK